jgi:2-keto-4-pentenoate hydratase/2-oxohepta-3-ene-1,7-dioic acid hydratase in catechol pathway
MLVVSDNFLCVGCVLCDKSLAMKYCRFHQNGQSHYGLIESVAGREVITRILLMSNDSESLDEMHTRRMEPLPLDSATLLAPVEPSKIICVGRNYREHAKELGHEIPVDLLTFFKPPSSILAPGAAIERPRISERVDHEGELGVVIAKRCRKLRDDEDVREYIRGYTCVNDVTARDLQKIDNQWTRAKGFDTFCPVGPVVVDELDPWAGVRVESRVNGELRQEGNTADFIFPLDVIIRTVSRVMTLLPGDLIATGTPAGVGPLQAGDTVEISVDGVGVLRNPVVDEQ